jgi:excisionase family DNA binding protein
MATELLTAKQVAVLLDAHVDTVNRLRKSGRLPARLHGTRTYRYRRADVEALTTPLVAAGGDIDRRLAAALRAVADQLDPTGARNLVAQDG